MAKKRAKSFKNESLNQFSKKKSLKKKTKTPIKKHSHKTPTKKRSHKASSKKINLGVKKDSSKDKLRKNFYNFQKKIDRLEEFKHELNSLENKGLTKGFEKEVNILRSRLKDTTALPQLEKRMTALRKNIRSKRTIKKKSPIKGIQTRVGRIDNTVSDTNVLLRKGMSKVEHIDDTVGDTNTLLRKDMKDLKLSVDEGIERMTEKPKSIDSGVGLIVDEEFQDFVKSIKLELTEKVKNKEKIICSLNTAYLKILMGVEKLNKDQLRIKSGVIKTTLVKALAGKNIYMLTANKIALALCIDVESILN